MSESKVFDLLPELNRALYPLSQEEGLYQLWEQLMKDAQLSGVVLPPVSKMSLEVFHSALANVLATSDSRAYQAFLYRVDVPEEAVRAARENQSFESTIAWNILQREALKVIMRHRYKG